MVNLCPFQASLISFGFGKKKNEKCNIIIFLKSIIEIKIKACIESDNF